MRVATLNTWGDRGDRETRFAAMRDGFARLDADIITLQETVVTDSADMVAEVLGPSYHCVHGTVREHGGDGVPSGQGISTASRWPIGEVHEVDLRVTDRTGDFACTCLISEVLAPAPYGRNWVANHFPDYQLDHEHERVLQAVAVARRLEELVRSKPGHVLVAGDFDAEPDADSMRFWTGRHTAGGTSVCYRSATEAVLGPAHPVETYTPANPLQHDPDWPFRAIDHVLCRCVRNGPSLLATSARRVFDTGPTIVSDHYGLAVDYEVAPGS